MDDRLADRVGAASGIAFVVLDLIGAFMYPEQPRSDSPPGVTLAWVHDHRVALQWGMILSPLAAAALVWFVGYLRVRVRPVEGGGPDPGPMVLAGGVAVAVMLALAVMPTAILAFMDSQPAGLRDMALVRMFGDLNTVFFSAVSAMTVVFLAALALPMLRRVLLARWVGWLAALVAAVNVVAVWVEVTFSSYHGKAWNAVGWGANIGLIAVVLVCSVMTLAGGSRRLAAAPTPSIAV
ncbi:MAG TPA: hypothetical protein VE991_14240 [Acidimicrobiales bacterium]|nr:hypothetical protein [Acidimicrobiales bacterium]